MKFTIKKPLILASSSPRRKELLSLIGIPFDVVHSQVDENIALTADRYPEYVMGLAEKKARAVANKYRESIVIGADTIVVFDRKVYPKPATEEEAEQFLKEFSGKTHSVYTGVAIINDREKITFYNKTDVTFRDLDEELIRGYIASGDPMDKAGGYGIQTAGALFVDSITGDYQTVVGLPIAKLTEVLRKEGLIELKDGETILDN
ncbi:MULTISPECIES: Maf family protein [Sporosarcina]|uniref:dTTP/UTP pyrophosphatase n=1 Tax=Sporosarcina contaminans TaxID=633403 RepID=A0ABW3TWZ3_9BACL